MASTLLQMGLPGTQELMLLLIIGIPVSIAYYASKHLSSPLPQNYDPDGEYAVEPDQELRNSIPEQERYELQKVARKSIPMTMLASIIAPLGYLMVGKTGWAIVAAITGNFLVIFGALFIPFHTRKIILDARAELAAAGVKY